MSAFLWVEDFEGSQYREFAHAIFGKSLGLDSSFFPNSESGLREFLYKRKIYLVTDYCEAMQFILKRLNDVDSIVLDIDLNLLAEHDHTSLSIVSPVLKKWYQYDPSLTDEAEEASFNAARDQMKMIAGYHLYTELVMNRSFPRDRILFCSNHGSYLEAMNESFGNAKIEAPEIFRKGDIRVGDWTCDQRAEKYIRLRRWVIIACQIIHDRLILKETRYRLPNLPSVQDGQLSEEHATMLLETLPMLLPLAPSRTEDKHLAFRIFVRTLTQDWDKINLGDIRKKPSKSFHSVLKHARNWTSHDSKALSKIEELDVAFLFLLAMRSAFEFDDITEDFEYELMRLIGPQENVDEQRLKESYEESYLCVKLIYSSLQSNVEANHFDKMVNDLQIKGLVKIDDQAKYLRQIYWHRLHWPDTNGKFSPKSSDFSQSKFSKELSERLLAVSF